MEKLQQKNLIKSWIFAKLGILITISEEWKRRLKKRFLGLYWLQFWQLVTGGLRQKRVSREIQAGRVANTPHYANKYYLATPFLVLSIALPYIKYLFDPWAINPDWYHLTWYDYFNVTGHIYASVVLLIGLIILYQKYKFVFLPLIGYNSYIIYHRTTATNNVEYLAEYSNAFSGIITSILFVLASYFLINKLTFWYNHRIRSHEARISGLTLLEKNKDITQKESREMRFKEVEELEHQNEVW